MPTCLELVLWLWLVREQGQSLFRRIIFSLCRCVSHFSSGAPSVWLGPFFVFTILKQRSCRVGLSWALAYFPPTWRLCIKWCTISTAPLCLIGSESQTLFTTGCSLQGILQCSVSFLCFIYRICFPFFSMLLFCWRLIAAPAEQLQRHVVKWIRSSMDGNSRLRKRSYWPWLEHGGQQKMKVADDKCLLVSDFDACSQARMIVLRWNMNKPAGPMNMLTEYAPCHFNTPVACRHVIIYTPEVSLWMS